MLEEFFKDHFAYDVPERWMKKSTLFMPPEDQRVILLRQVYEHGYTHQEFFYFDTPCCLWDGWNDGKGHGKVSVEGKPVYLHRESWERHNKIKLSKSDVVDHLCRNRPCWNPLHVEPVSMKLNTDRGLGRFQQFRKREEYA